MKARTNSPATARAPLYLAAAAALVCSVALAPCVSAQGQAFKFQGGSSSLFGGHGGSVEVRGSNFTTRVGFGFLNGNPHYGISYTTMWHGVTWGAGDQAISFTLPTDIFNSSYYFLGRGVSAAWKNSRSSLFVYGGATSAGFTTPFLNLAEARRRAGLIFYEYKLSPSLRFSSRNVLAARQTSIQSLEWTPTEQMQLGFSGGVGSNQRYWAGSFALDQKWIEVSASYTQAGDAFRRIRVDEPLTAETDRENIRVALKPLRNLQFIASRQNFLSPLQSGAGSERAAVNSYSAWTSLHGVHVHGSLFDAATSSGRARGITAGARREWFNRVETAVDYMRSSPSSGPAFHTVVATVRERITPRISLSQTLTTGSGQTYVSYGGSFLSNRFSFGVEYQTIFLPFLTTDRSQFKQVLAVNVRLRLWSNVELNGATDVTPLGKLRYTAYGTGFAYRGGAYPQSGGSMGGAFYEYVVRGRVVEEGGQPIRGAAVKIDDNVVFTDSQGSFLYRRKKQSEGTLAVALDQFILPGNYQVVSAPSKVKAAREESAELYEVVLKRLPNAPQVGEVATVAASASQSGTNVQTRSVLELPQLRLSRPSSTELLLAYRMPVAVPDASPPPSRPVVRHSSSVGSYYLYPAAGGAPIDLSPVKVRYADANGQRGARRAASGKR